MTAPASPACPHPPQGRQASCTVSVIICAYTQERWSGLCASVDSAVGAGATEVIVVVDHNDALLERAARRWGTTGSVRAIGSEGPRGLSGARNTGARAALCDLVAFLDDDAVADAGWATALTAVFDDPDVLCAGGSVAVWGDAPVPAWWPPEFNWVVGCSWVGLPQVTSDIRNPIGCNMAFRRPALLASGGFSDAIGRTPGGATGCEET